MHSSTVAVLLLALAAGQSAVAAPIQSTPVQARDAELDARTVHLLAPLIENLQNSVVGGLNPRDLQALYERGLFGDIEKLGGKVIGHFFSGGSSDDNDDSSAPQPAAGQQGQATRRALAELLERELDERSFASAISSIASKIPKFLPHLAAGAVGAGIAGSFFGGSHSSPAPDAPAPTATAPVDAPTAVGGTAAPAERDVVEYLAKRGVLEDYLANELSGRSLASAIEEAGKFAESDIGKIATKFAGHIGSGIFSGIGSQQAAPPTVIVQAPAPAKSAAAPSATSAPAARDIVDHLIQRELNDRSLGSFFKNPLIQEVGGTGIEAIVSKVFAGHGPKATPNVITVQAPPAATAPAAANPAVAPPSRRLEITGPLRTNLDPLPRLHFPFELGPQENHVPFPIRTSALPSATAIAPSSLFAVRRRDSDDDDVARVMSMFSRALNELD